MVMDTPRVSIIMSVYNGGSFLDECIESILKQTFKDFEFVIVDDGSTDGSWETMSRYAERDARIALLRNQPNEGVVRAINKGLDHSKAEIIARQDADDISHPERIQKQLDFLDTHGDYGLVAAVPRLIGENGVPLNHLHYTATVNDEIQVQLLDHMCLCGPTIMMRRTSLEEAGFYFTEGMDASEDYDICLRLAEVTKLSSIEGNLYLYRRQPDSASSKRAAQQMFNKATALENAISRRYAIHPPDDLIATVARDYLHAAIIGFARGNLEGASQSLGEALRVYPSILKKDQPLQDLIRAYTPNSSSQAALEFTQVIFRDLIPGTIFLNRMRSRLFSYLHMSQVFDGAKTGNYSQVDQHLWPGIRHRPAWLFNRGVVSIMIMSIFRRVSPRDEGMK